MSEVPSLNPKNPGQAVVSLPLVKVAMPPRDRLMKALEDVLYGGMIAEGEQVSRFEAEFANIFRLPLGLGTSSGTGALHIALLLADVMPGDEVITTSMTAEPTNTVILQCGAKPILPMWTRKLAT